MEDRILSVFVDESGNFDDISDPARYCIVTLVLHDQSRDISRCIRELDRANYDLGIDPEHFQFHTAPLIRQEGVFSVMSRTLRGRLLDRMLTFVRHVDFKYHCFCTDTSFANSSEQVLARLEQSMSDWLQAHRIVFESVDRVKVYYDAGQKSVGRLLQNAFTRSLPCPIVYAQGVRQPDYKLLQVADLPCTMKLLEIRLESGLQMNVSERRFFGGPRDFKRYVLHQLRAKEL